MRPTAFRLSAGRAYMFGWTEDYPHAKVWHRCQLEDGTHPCSQLQEEYDTTCRDGYGRCDLTMLGATGSLKGKPGDPHHARRRWAANMATKQVLLHQGDPWLCNPPVPVPDGHDAASWAEAFGQARKRRARG